MTDESLSNNKTTGQPDNLDTIPEPAHPSRASLFMTRAVIAGLITIAISLGVFFRWSFASSNVLEVKNNPFPARVVNDPTGQTGGIVFLKINYCKYLDVVGELRMSYVSKSREIFLPITNEQLPKGCNNKEFPVVIPLNLAQDTYKIKFRVTHDVNPVKRNITGNFESQPVTVGSNTAE